jgi:uncharacterized membrane protein YbhN (UPF0104 family)
LRRFNHPAVRVAGTILLIAVLFAAFPRDRLMAALRDVDWRVPAAAVPAYLAIHLGSVWKWHTLSRHSGAGLGWLAAAECYFAGLFATLFLPSLAGGDAMMATLASRRSRSTAGVVTAVVLGRTLDIIGLAVLLALSAGFVPGGLRRAGATPAAVGWAGSGVVILACAAVTLWLCPSLRPGFLARFLAEHREAFTPIRRPRVVAGPLAMAVAVQTAFAFLAWLVAQGCGLRIGPGVWLFAWSIAKLVAFLPVSIAGIGTRELALAGLLAPMGAPWAVVIASALAWDAVVLAGCLAGGGIWKSLGRFRPAVV